VNLALLGLLLKEKGLSRSPTLLHNPEPSLNALGELLAGHTLQPLYKLIDTSIWMDPVSDGDLLHPRG
jgi:hypothetical protein